MTTAIEDSHIKGRFAPSPSGRMHLGNISTALLSWLSVKSRGGKWVLRHEDLDRERSKPENMILIEEDLKWLGLEWDEGGLDDKGSCGPYLQNERSNLYMEALSRLAETGMVYPCRCARRDLMASQAPHQSDGRVVYPGTCRPSYLPDKSGNLSDMTLASDFRTLRLAVPDEEIGFNDMLYGQCSFNLARECGDFVLMRRGGAFAYQLAVVADDAAMGITEVARGNDLLLSTSQQIYLYRLLGLDIPQFHHLPLLVNKSGQRLAKRDVNMDLAALRKRMSPTEVIGKLAFLLGLVPEPEPITPSELIPCFSLSPLRGIKEITVPDDFSDPAKKIMIS